MGQKWWLRDRNSVSQRGCRQWYMVCNVGKITRMARTHFYRGAEWIGQISGAAMQHKEHGA